MKKMKKREMTLIMDKTWEETLPCLNKQITKGQVFKYDGHGFTRELTTENNDMIVRITAQYPKVKVVAVIDGTYVFGNKHSEDVQNHVDYLLIDEEGPLVAEDGKVEFLSYTVNKSYGDEEMGCIQVKERLGLLKRVS